MSELEAELAEQSHLRLQAAGESEFLKAELEDLRRVRDDTEKEHKSVTEIESKRRPPAGVGASAPQRGVDVITSVAVTGGKLRHPD